MGTSQTVTQSFFCQEFDAVTASQVQNTNTTAYHHSVERFLKADMTISCDDRRYKWLHRYGQLMVLVYPVGVPLITLLLLYKRRRIIEHRKSREGPKSLRGLSFLFRMYRVEDWWMAPVDMARRLCLSSFLFNFGPTNQLLMAFCIGAGSIVVVREVAPFYDDNMDMTYGWESQGGWGWGWG